MTRQIPTKTQLIEEVRSIDRHQSGEAFSPATIAKVLGTPKSRYSLTKQELSGVLDAWKSMLAQCPKTANWKTLTISTRMVSLCADGERWVDYFGFPSLQAARQFQDWILPHCHWAMVRKGGQRVNASFECKVWGLDQQIFQALVNRETSLVFPPLTQRDRQHSLSQYPTHL
ncbi:hypothetical protein [Phormidium sp. CCY1219]|uniref:hypothetical protein n=1 Tax=Phormidium sp. CCY1219 TaxID=2886104 RepID=UPI002D1EB12E|nr:hypothetical protein [Phormidium sp. CCY1219]MEB3830987.1 hypothetical protein [Phormidium sp. CCY1219]